MRAVAIVGPPGSGKTTTARRLADQTGLEHIEIDGVFWQPGWKQLETNEFRRRVQHRMDDAGAGWVTDGNYNGQLAGLVQQAADTILWLDMAKLLVVRRVVTRTVRRAVTREKLWNGNREPLTNFTSWDPHKNIIRWAWVHFDRYRSLYAERSTDGTWAHATVFRLRTQAEIDDWLDGACDG